MFRKLTPLLCFVLQIACKNPNQSNLDHLTADPSANNVALLMTGDLSGGVAWGIREDVDRMEETLVESLGFKAANIVRHDQVGKSQINEFSAQAATKVGEQGTLFMFIGTHGSPTGHLSLSDGRFTTFGNLANSMRAARGDQAFKRLVVFIMACFSGNNVNGRSEITQNTGEQNERFDGQNFDYGHGGQYSLTGGPAQQNFHPVGPINPVQHQQREAIRRQLYFNRVQAIFAQMKTANNQNRKPLNQKSEEENSDKETTKSKSNNGKSPAKGKLYEQLIVIASSARNRLSWTSGNGSVAGHAFRRSVEELKRENPAATIGELLERTEHYGSSQGLVTKVDPPDLKSSEKVFE